ncbi:hypothetical protein SISNIDRAFT_460986 [Sistotremastrum niveocremeum HHB9708]|uniref:N-acetyltransferase domain-containing protein n=1 Tax=Sistotremastrum niveocremeum HHB9708 TaxID=1314777 RepID=A0A164N5F4_9AGAM|nr:hypothetical protein SISNIDRAFT_460986 [Sistotremastrum niveocremeum HHB9708]
MVVYLREATEADKPVIAHISLLTADAGTSADHLLTIKELPPLAWALPYISLPTGFGYVLVKRGDEDGAKEEVMGYIVATSDTVKWREAALTIWEPPLKIKYPLEMLDSPEFDLTELDKYFIKRIHHPITYAQEMLDFSPAHFHISILPELQGQGWGRKMIVKVAERLKEIDPTMEGVWNGIEPRNLPSIRFYTKIGGEYQKAGKDGHEYFKHKFSTFGV